MKDFRMGGQNDRPDGDTRAEVWRTLLLIAGVLALLIAAGYLLVSRL